MPTLETIQPYVEQLFDDSEVQKQLGRASANLGLIGGNDSEPAAT